MRRTLERVSLAAGSSKLTTSPIEKLGGLSSVPCQRTIDARTSDAFFMAASSAAVSVTDDADLAGVREELSALPVCIVRCSHNCYVSFGLTYHLVCSWCSLTNWTMYVLAPEKWKGLSKHHHLHMMFWTRIVCLQPNATLAHVCYCRMGQQQED
jgi:hypothetical protein